VFEESSGADLVSNAHVWRAAQERLRQEMTRAQFDTWLRGTWLADERDGVTVLCVRTTFAKELLETRYRERIETAIASVTGTSCTLQLVVVANEPASSIDGSSPSAHAGDTLRASSTRRHSHAVDREGPTLFESSNEMPRAFSTASAALQQPYADRSAAGLERPASSAGTGQANHVAAETGAPVHSQLSIVRAGGQSSGPSGSEPPIVTSPQIEPPRLNLRYTFSTFIVGSGNQLAHAASQAVADTPGKAYNPLFLYGGVGLGKTHLLHAVGHTALARSLVVLYVSSETFTNEIVNAIRYRTTEEFRAKYRSVDVLLVDDIQFIAGKDSTEEEFFHTFNSLYESSKQIVMCSDRPPKAIVSLEERLRSRFEWGLIADIQPPDLETRVAILRAKSDVMGRSVPDEVIDYLASRVQSNIRDLEGSFNRLLAMNQLQGLPLTLETAKVALNNLASDGQQKRVSLDEILEAVAEYYRIPREDLCGKQRDKHIVVPRQIAMFLMRQETQASLLDIGNMLGGRDHSTVLHGCEKIAREVNDNTALRKEVMTIRQQLLG
jgi:chromosomal replication initiator protein